MDKFQAFSKAILDASNEGLDVDGFTIQELAEKHKVVVVVPYDPDKHGPNEFDVMPGDDWYEYVPELCSPDTSVEGTETLQCDQCPEIEKFGELEKQCDGRCEQSSVKKGPEL